MNKIFTKFTLAAIVGLVVVSTGCKKSVETDPLLPVIGSTVVESTSRNAATISVIITSFGGSAISEQGVVIGSEKIKYTIDPNWVLWTPNDSATSGGFNMVVPNLKLNSGYKVKAYATNATGTTYGKEVSFKTKSTLSTMKDIDGNEYEIVTIGTQTWTVQDLRVTRYRDGSNIPNVTNNNDWHNMKSGALCYYNNDKTNKSVLYNWYAFTNTLGIAPDGWHIPSENEWSTLYIYLGVLSSAERMKETGTSHWLAPNTRANNGSDFTAVPTGKRDQLGVFSEIDKEARWLSTERYPPVLNRWKQPGEIGTNASIRFDDPWLALEILSEKNIGAAIRLVKD